ncbi:MAG: tRNA dihydrouridine synthase DusB [Pseudomonadota bacterium]
MHDKAGQALISVGNVTIRNPVFLAPMSGVSDLPFRRIAWAEGAGLVVSEMIASEQLARGDDEALLKLKGEGIDPHVVQLAGREAKWMALGAKMALDSGADIIDINMGCPAKKVTGGLSGSALMRDLDHALTLIEATVDAVDCPVTLKMRLGWDPTSINAPELARRAEDAGVQMVTIHGRTRSQFYKGTADWRAIRAVSEAVSVPVIANGDVRSVDDATSILEASGADGVMIGRGAYGKPWLPGHAARYLADKTESAAPHGSELSDLVMAHYQALLSHYGPYLGCLCARKHLSWYLDAADPDVVFVSQEERKALLTAKDPPAVERQIPKLFSRIGPPQTGLVRAA